MDGNKHSRGAVPGIGPSIGTHGQWPPMIATSEGVSYYKGMDTPFGGGRQEHIVLQSPIVPCLVIVSPGRQIE